MRLEEAEDNTPWGWVCAAIKEVCWDVRKDELEDLPISVTRNGSDSVGWDMPIRASTKFGFTDKLDGGPKVGVTEVGGVRAHKSAQGSMGGHTHAVRPDGTGARWGVVTKEGMGGSQNMLLRR